MWQYVINGRTKKTRNEVEGGGDKKTGEKGERGRQEWGENKWEMRDNKSRERVKGGGEKGG